MNSYLRNGYLKIKRQKTVRHCLRIITKKYKLFSFFHISITCSTFRIIHTISIISSKVFISYHSCQTVFMTSFFFANFPREFGPFLFCLDSQDLENSCLLWHHSGLQFSPKILNWIQVWTLAWQLQNIDIVLCQTCLDNFDCVFWVVVSLEGSLFLQANLLCIQSVFWSRILV